MIQHTIQNMHVSVFINNSLPYSANVIWFKGAFKKSFICTLKPINLDYLVMLWIGNEGEHAMQYRANFSVKQNGIHLCRQHFPEDLKTLTERSQGTLRSNHNQLDSQFYKITKLKYICMYNTNTIKHLKKANVLTAKTGKTSMFTS